MKLLLTSDLHYDDCKLGWILERAETFDAILVAGDFLDIFVPAGNEIQQAAILRWKADLLVTGTPLVWCSGNHDFFHGEDSPLIEASPDWMPGLESGFIGDGVTDILHTRSGDLAITTIPWPVTGVDIFKDGTHVPHLDYVADLLDQGRRLQARYPWMVLFHEPPADSPLSIGYSTSEARLSRQLVEKWSPDWSLHGHVHESATQPGGNFICQIGKSTCVNSGQSGEGELPHYSVLTLDGSKWQVEWTGGGKAGHAEGAIAPR